MPAVLAALGEQCERSVEHGIGGDGRPVSKAEREEILGFGQDGA